MKEKKDYSNITEGVIWKSFILYFLPIFLGTLFQQSYSTADAVIVGRFVGKEALAATDVTGSAISFLINTAVGISSGGAVIISQRYGANDDKGVRYSVHTTFVFLFILGIIISVAGVIFAPRICSIMKVPDDMLAEALTYTRTFLAGAFFTLIYNAGTAILRAVGDSKRPFYFLMASCIINVLLDCLFVIVFHWGIFGAAFASVVSQGISAFLVTFVLIRSKTVYGLKKSEFKIHKETLKEILKIGAPIVLQSSTLSVSTIFLQSGINRFGTDAVSAWSVNGKMDYMLWMLIQSMGIAATTFTAQNYGAKNKKRIFQSTYVSLAVFTIIIVSLSIVLYFLTPLISHIFIADEKVIDLASEMMRHVAPFYIATIGGNILSSAIRGTGDSLIPMILTITGTSAVSIIWVLIIGTFDHDVYTVIAGFPISWIITSAMFFIYYYFPVRKRWQKLSDM